MRPRWAAFSALLLLLQGALVHALVPAPENVTVRCGDQRPMVSWDYSPQQPTTFTVQMAGGQTQTVDHELDLSDFVWINAEQMFNFQDVTVTAAQGPNRSEPSQPLSFSYNRYKTATVTCHLMFPPVTLTGEGAKATLSFENPLHFYKELRPIKHHAVFDLTIIIAKRSHQDRGCEREPVCTFSVDLPEDTEPCVNLRGVISYGAEQILVEHSNPTCAAAPTVTIDVFWLVTILILVVFIVVISIVTFAVCKTRAWDMSKVPTPQTLAPTPQKTRPSLYQSETVYSSVQITGTRPRTTEDPESPSPQSSHQVREGEDQVLIPPPDFCEDQDESGESTKTETLSLHSSGSEMEASNYEGRPQLVEMDMSGDVVMGYTR